MKIINLSHRNCFEIIEKKQKFAYKFPRLEKNNASFFKL